MDLFGSYQLELNPEVIIGIDPGKSGAITYKKNGTTVSVKMPETRKEIFDYFAYIKSLSNKAIAGVEEIGMRLDDITGKTKGGKENKFMIFRLQTMIRNQEMLKSYLIALNIPYIPVYPISWQSFLNLRRKYIDKTERKNAYKNKAAQYFPELKVTLINCDALLILKLIEGKLIYDPKWLQKTFDKEHKL